MTDSDDAVFLARQKLREAEGALGMLLRPDPVVPNLPSRCAWHCPSCDCPERSGGLSVVKLAQAPFPCPKREAKDMTPKERDACARVMASLRPARVA